MMKSTILLVDDNRDILEVLSEELKHSYQLFKAFNGEQAIKILEKETIHLIISDVMMPKMDGFELCEKLKSNFEYSHIPIILLTAKNTLESKITGLKHGADAYIEKPFDITYLVVQTENLLANRSKLRQYFAQAPHEHLKNITGNREDVDFLEKLNQAIIKNMDNQELDVDLLAATLNVSRTSLFRKIKGISDLTPNELINFTRLKRAAELLSEGTYRIYEVSDMVGFGSQTHFGKSFFKQYGQTPTEFQKKMFPNKN